jgi:hypothetical protein
MGFHSGTQSAARHTKRLEVDKSRPQAIGEAIRKNSPKEDESQVKSKNCKPFAGAGTFRNPGGAALFRHEGRGR